MKFKCNKGMQKLQNMSKRTKLRTEKDNLWQLSFRSEKAMCEGKNQSTHTASEG
jgi:hypothetical protein